MDDSRKLEPGTSPRPTSRIVTRRDVLKGAAGAAGLVGASLILPSWLAGCAPSTTPKPSGSGAAGSAAAAASGSAGTAAGPQRGGRLRTAHLGSSPAETLDPAKSGTLLDEARDRQLYDTLTFYDAKMQLQYWLAESVEPNADATQFNIKLRKGVTFHDGKPFTADDVLYTWHRILDPKTASGGAGVLAYLDLNSTKKVSDNEITVALTQPQIDFPAMLTGREQSITQNGATDFSNPVGTGPFMFVSFTPGQRSLFKRNPNYWQSGQPYVDEVEMISIPDNTARVNALLAGQVDAMENLTFADARLQQGAGKIRVLTTKSMACIPFYMQMDVAPFNIPEVRQALRLSIDRPATVATGLSGFGDVGNDLFGLGASTYASGIQQRTYDPEQAKALLKKVGQEDLHITLHTSPGSVGNVESSQAWAEQAKASGITVEVKNWDVAKYGADIYNKVPFSQTYWNYPPEIMFLEALGKSAPYNETHYLNPAYDTLYAESQRTTDNAKRQDVYNELQQMLWDDGGYDIWGFIQFTDATSNKVQGLIEHPYFNLGAFQYRTWWLEA